MVHIHMLHKPQASVCVGLACSLNGL
uniref:Uncharacterized protein n=1 Tax=Anguilla anguilla TaxID=7936 RepID=A0A0E9TW54_ANGAN